MWLAQSAGALPVKGLEFRGPSQDSVPDRVDSVQASTPPPKPQRT